MHRIDSPGAAVALPQPAAVGTTVGFWTAGDPGGGVPPTVLDQDWLNAVQEELLAVLTAASLNPTKANRAQVLAALRVLCAPQVVAFTANGTLTPPPGKTRALLRLWAGGGSGGTTVNANSVASGGGGGQFAWGLFNITTPQAVTVGLGGAVNNAPGGNGNPGGTTAVGALITAGAGTGGTGANGNSAVTAGAGGTGGIGGNILAIPGAGGGLGYPIGNGAFIGGIGGSSPFGAPYTPPNAGFVSSPGSAGQFPGGGGAGGVLGAAGGPGSGGLVLAEWYP